MMKLSPDHFTLSQAQATHLLASMCTFVKDNTARKEVSFTSSSFMLLNVHGGKVSFSAWTYIYR